MKKYLSMLAILLLLGAVTSEAQVYYAPGGYSRPYYRRQRPANDGNFKPSLTLSFGYGFPNLDKNYLGAFTNSYMGNVSQYGPISGALDYQFSRYTSIGIMATYGQVKAPYYDAYSNAQAFTGQLQNVSVMLDLINYFPTYSTTVQPYLRTAIGVNSWTQNYTNSDGSPMNNVPTPDELAYQVSLGVKFHVSKGTGLFLEAGYGKYILAGGLSCKL